MFSLSWFEGVRGSGGVLSTSTRSTTRYLVRLATKNMCLHEEWCDTKKGQLQLFTVPIFCLSPGVTVMRYDLVYGFVIESTLYY